MPAPLNLGKVVYGAFAIPWRDRAAFSRALAVPFFFMALISSAFEFLDSDRLTWPVLVAWILAYLLVFVLFAVTCHRLVLLGGGAVAPLPRWTRRELRFLSMGLVVGFLCVAPGVVLAFAAVSLMAGTQSAWLAMLTVPLFLLPMFYLLARLSLVFPAIALDREVGLGWAWAVSRGNSWRLFFVVGILPWLVSAPASLVAFAEPNIAVRIGMAILGVALLVVEITALSLSYRELTKQETATSA